MGSLQLLVAEARQSLGQREDLAAQKDLNITLQRMLHKLDPQQPAWPSPRSWVMASELHRAGLEVAAAIGAATATEFHGAPTQKPSTCLLARLSTI